MNAGQPRTQHKGVGIPRDYDLSVGRAALVGVDFQRAFGNEGWEHVPHADAAVAKFRELAGRWRDAGGTVIYVHTTFYAGEKIPPGREALLEGNEGAAFYPGLVEDGDIMVRKLGFSAVVGSNLLEVLGEAGFDTAIVGGLTTPICVETTVDGLSMAGINVAVLSDATASQPIGDFSAELAHEFSIARMGYLIGQVVTTDSLVTSISDAVAG